MIKFDFITDTKFSAILERDYKELENCLEHSAYKSVLVLSGSIIEAILIDYFLTNLPNGKKQDDIFKLTLVKLIEEAFNCGLITQRSKDLSSVIRNYRNLIHSGREVRTNETFDEDSAIVAKSLLKMIINDIRENFLKHKGYSATEIISKIQNDTFSSSIYENLLLNIKNPEKIKLLELLVEYNLHNKTDLFDTKYFIDKLKAHVPQLTIKDYLIKLKNKVEVGNLKEIMIYYDLFHDNLNLIEDNDKEIILVYILSVLEKTVESNKELKTFYNKKIFLTVGEYIISDIIFDKLKLVIENLISNYDSSKTDYYFRYYVYDQIINSLTENKLVEFNDFMKTKYIYKKEIFLVEYEKWNLLPF